MTPLSFSDEAFRLQTVGEIEAIDQRVSVMLATE
jgi:hypothetical protein